MSNSNKVTMEQVFQFLQVLATRQNEMKLLSDQLAIKLNEQALHMNAFVNMCSAAAPAMQEPNTPTHAGEKDPAPTIAEEAPKLSLLEESLAAMNKAVSGLSRPQDRKTLHLAIDNNDPNPQVQVSEITNTAPTEKGTAPPAPANELQSLLAVFQGHNSIIGKLLSPTVFSGGRGMIMPGFEGFKIYNEDVVKTSPSASATWPSGFYTDEATKEMQFFMNLPSVLVFVERLPSSTGNISVRFKAPEGPQSLVNIADINNRSALHFLVENINIYVEELSKPKF